MKTQNNAILEHLQRGLTINPMLALRMYGCFRLAARIHDLKKLGHGIEVEVINREGQKFAQYKMGGRTI